MELASISRQLGILCGVFGIYNVKIDVPSGYIVAASSFPVKSMKDDGKRAITIITQKMCTTRMGGFFRTLFMLRKHSQRLKFLA